MSDGRAGQKDLIDFFGRALGVTNGTMSTQISFPADINLLQVQFDTESSATNTSFQISRSGTVIKRGWYLSGAGTREVSWLGRAISCPDGIAFTRPSGDSHTIWWTLIYTRK